MRNECIVGLDIGTTKVACVIGELAPSGAIDIVGIGTAPTEGLRRGVVIHIEDTVRSINAAVEEAETMAGLQVESAFAGISGSHIRSLNSEGVVHIQGSHVADEDVAKVLEIAQALRIPTDREFIHVLPQEFTVDDQDGIQDPRGMAGVRLIARAHIVTASATAAQNVVHCCNATGLNVRDIVLQPLASAEAVLARDEKQLGVVLIDIGGGTTDIAVFHQGSAVFSHVLPVGGEHITRDIAYGLKATLAVAEKAKKEHGVAMQRLVEEDSLFDVQAVGGDRVGSTSRRRLAEIIEPRVEEIFDLVAKELERSGYRDRLPAGVVLTGGGAQMRGMTEIAEKVLGLSARHGVPRGVGGLSDVVASPIYATSVGLLKFGALYGRRDDRWRREKGPVFDRLLTVARDWWKKVK